MLILSYEEKLKAALEILGNRHTLAKNSTFKYCRGATVLTEKNLKKFKRNK